jgi:hypothetical protein
MGSWSAPEDEYFEGNPDYENEHYGVAGQVDMGHGSSCNHCNDAILKNMGERTRSFAIGRLEHTFMKKYGEV